MIILLDAMGGDNAPDANIKGAVAAINQINAELWLIGKEEVIKAKLKEFYNKTAEEISPRLKIYNATETIEMEDTPTPVSYTHLDVYKRQVLNTFGYSQMTNKHSHILFVLYYYLELVKLVFAIFYLLIF